MCIPHNNRYRVIRVQEPPYQAWLNSAVCVTKTFYRRHGFTFNVCSECIRKIYPRDWENCRTVNRHFLYIHSEPFVSKCTDCFEADTNIRQPVSSCFPCTQYIASFAEYLRTTDDEPYNSPEATVIALPDPIDSE